MGTGAAGRPLPEPAPAAPRPPPLAAPWAGVTAPAVQLSRGWRARAAPRASRAPAPEAPPPARGRSRSWPRARARAGKGAEFGKSSRSFCREKGVEEWGCRREKPASCE